jgi:hypothetical protein
MATGSTVMPAKVALHQLLSTGLPDVTVLYGPRVPAPTSGAWVRISGRIQGNTALLAQGHERPMTERYSIPLTITVSRVGDGNEALQIAVEQRVAEIAAAVETLVRTAPGEALGVDGVLIAAVAGQFTLDDSPAAEKGPATATLAMTVEVTADYELGI